MTEQTLKPCPFCGSADIRIDAMDSFIIKMSRVMCWGCGNVTQYINRDIAIKKWNTRVEIIAPSSYLMWEMIKCQKACNDLVEKKNKLLEFVKKINAGFNFSLRKLLYLQSEAEKLLKEIGEAE